MSKIYFSTNLEYLRKLKGLTQSELADKLNVTEQVISHWENGRRQPNNMQMIGNIAELFNVKEDLLFTDLRIESNTEEYKEKEFLEKYKRLPDNDKELVNNIVDTRISQSNQ